MKNVIALLAIITVTLGMIACGKKGGGKIPAPAPVAAVCPNNVLCPGVVNPNDVGPIAYAMQNMQSTVLGSQVSFSTGGAYAEVLKQLLGVCDRVGIVSGVGQCINWANGYNLIRMSFPNQVSNQPQITVFSQPMMSGGFSFNFSIGWDNGSMARNPLVANATINPVNSDRGFEVRMNGATDTLGYNKYIALRIENGKIGDNSLQVTVHLIDQNQYRMQVASGTLYRCNAITCGLPF